MLPKIDFTETAAYQYLADHYIRTEGISLRERFASDPERFAKFSLAFEDILLDYSKNRIDEETIALLVQLARECELDKAIEAMFTGAKINETEGREVLHTALRSPAGAAIFVDGENVIPKVQAVLVRMLSFTECS